MENNQTQSPMNNVVIMGNQYGKPVVTSPPIMTTPTLVIVNQDSTNILHPSQYKTVPVCCQCPNCNKMMTTFVVKKVNCCALCLCLVTGVLWYVLIQCFRGKDLCCYDASHTCPNCNALVGSYTSC